MGVRGRQLRATSSLAGVQNNDRVCSTDIPCPRCGEPLLVDEKGILAANPSQPVGWAIQDLRWCWNGCQYTASEPS